MQIPDKYEVLDTKLLGERLGYKYSTMLTHLSRKRWDKIPEPSRRLAIGPLWYLGDVEEWESKK